MKKQRIHLICNAHIDPIWQWDWQEGASAVLSTFRSAANLADKYDYIFCHTHRHSCCIAWDRVHPNQTGATLIAREFLKSCDFDFCHNP